MLTPEQRDQIRDWWDSESESDTAGQMLANLDAVVERIVVEQVTAALDEVARAIRKERHDRLSQMERNGMKVAELAVREVRQSLIGDEPCSCGAPESYSLNPTEVVVHRRDGQPCYIAPAQDGEVRS